jgi:hypothetical protein
MASDGLTASIIVRFANKSDRRARNLRILINHLRRVPNLEVIVSVMENDIAGLAGVRKNFVDASFESARANNIGASLASGNILIFHDADVLIESRDYTRVMDAIDEGYESVRASERCIELSDVDLPRFAKPEEIDDAIRDSRVDSTRDAPGAFMAITREAFVRIGGYCELFKVYGWEDCYFRLKAARLTYMTCLDRRLVHLPHEENYQMKDQPINAGLCRELLETDGGNCVKLAARDRLDLMVKYPHIIGDRPVGELPGQC